MHRSIYLTTASVLAALFTGVAFAAENLVPGGDFAAEKDGRPVWCRNEGGAFSVYTEDATWNKCGRLETGSLVHTNAQGYATRMAAVTMGGDAKTQGFAVTAGTRYDFSVDLRGGADMATVKVFAWKDDPAKRVRVRVEPDVNRVAVQKGWNGYRGTFVAPPDTTRAAIQVMLWSSTQYMKELLPAGAYVLIDNVKVEESVANLGSTPKAVTVERRKAMRVGGEVDDFLDFKNGGPAGVKSEIEVKEEDGALIVEAEFEEPVKLFRPTDGCMWRGDTIEVWFGPVGKDRLTSHFAVGIAGDLYAAVNGKAVPADRCFTAKIKVDEKDREWKVKLRIPFASFGWTNPQPGDTIAFNLGRHRQSVKQDITWSRLVTGFDEWQRFGTLVYGDFAAALKRAYGVSVGTCDRATYERKVAELEAEKQAAKFRRFKDARLSVAPVPVTSDFSVPFLPREIFDPPKEIALTAAVNELKSLPIAIANLTDRTEDYVVVLEHQMPYHAKPEYFSDLTGLPGLKGFPSGQIRCRKALKIRDTDSAVSPSLRLDPLPKADDSSSLSVAAKEAGLVWFEFDTTDVKPGVYPGRLRVIPLCEAGRFMSGKRGWHDLLYEGAMQVIPVTLTVRPIVLDKKPARDGYFCNNGLNEEAFGYAHEAGGTIFLVTPWHFTFERDAAGNLDYTRPTDACVAMKRLIREHLAWGERRGFRPKFEVCYSTVNAFRSIFNAKKDPAVDERLWPQFVKGLRLVMEECGVKADEWWYEAWDEPPSDAAADILRMTRLSKETEPSVRVCLGLGHHEMTIAELTEIAKYTDVWTPSDQPYWQKPLFTAFFLSELKKGKTVGHYVCSTSPRESLHAYFRQRAWVGERFGLSCDMFYQFYDANGPLGTRDYKGTTVGGLIYVLFGKVVPSVRYMALREGVMDMKYFAKLKAVAPDDPRVKALMSEALTRVLDTRRHDAAEPDVWREKAAELLLTLAAEGCGK